MNSAPTSLSDSEKERRVLLLSDFIRGIGAGDEARLMRTMRTILERDSTIADRQLVVRAIDETWTADARPRSAQCAVDFFLERPDVAARSGAYGV
jgi:hypothetical protein